MPPGETSQPFNGGTFGRRLDSTAMPGSFSAQSLLSSARYKELDRRQSYYDCTQHDDKSYDFDGRVMQISGPGAMVTQPLLTQEVAPYLVPLRARRPTAPYRLAKVIVGAFTNMVFGSQRFPSIRVEGDQDTQDFATALIKASNLETKMIRARNLGGAVGTVGISWCYDRKGRPRVEVHNGKHLHVHEWEDREELIPRWVSEVYLYPADEWDGQKRKFVRNWYWHRRDWTEDDDVLFVPKKYEVNREPEWEPDPGKSITHEDGFCHLNWVQNVPSDQADGLPDYEGLYENFDVLDILLSVISKGAILNLDPTVVLKTDADIFAATIQKGSDHTLNVGVDGGAEYLELTGQSLEAGVKLFNEKRRSALEVAQCVVPDPSEIAAQGVSSVALKTIFQPMLGQAEVLRAQYGGALKRVLEQMVEVAQLKTGAPVTLYVKNPETGEDEPKVVQLYVNLPKKIVREPVMEEAPPPGAPPAPGGPPGAPPGPPGAPPAAPPPPKQATDPATGKPLQKVSRVDQDPGQGGDVELDWPNYFPPTPMDQSQGVTALTTANGGKAVISQQTSVEQAALLYGIEGGDEWERVQKDGKEDDAKAADQASKFGDMGAGGKPGQPGAPKPPGGKPPAFGGSKPPFGGGDDDGTKASDSGPAG
jgi:hypothetical protein